MKRFLTNATTGTAGPSKKLKASSAAALQQQQTLGLADKLRHQEWTELDKKGSRVLYWPRMLSKASHRLLTSLLQEVPWEQRNVVIFGRSVRQPRLICYMADGPHLQYTYSGLTVIPQPWSPAVMEVKAAVEELCGCSFNSCLLNQYRTGHDSLSWHSDDEFQVYGPQPTIASVSFGECRDFVIRHQQHKQHKISVSLAPGDVLVMAGAMQQHWQHCVPQRKNVLGPRVNLTFRNLLHLEKQSSRKQQQQQQQQGKQQGQQQQHHHREEKQPG